MDFSNSKEALREAELDYNEGADILMVKPAMAYQDIIYRLKQNFNIPIVAYNVSGEYAMIKSVASQGLIDEKNVVIEVLTGIKRSGADLIITYYAKEAAKWLKEN
jgi:porphobilinogen synthase